MARICLVEDEKSLSDLIRMNLELEGFEVTSYENGRRAFEKTASFGEFDLVILDVMLPEVSGLDICKEIRKKSSVPVLFLSAKGTTEDRIAGLKLGGNDYLSKPFDLEELLLRVNVLTQRHPIRIVESTGIRIGQKEVNFSTYEVTDLRTNVTVTLSKKEIELLKLFIEKEGVVISRDEILDRVWGRDQFPTSRTIDNYILSFRKLFEDDPRSPKYFHSIRAVGYKFTNTK
ncbi:MAG: response regulator transcription factor [Flavobacteriia bacterium]|jgi:two-component system alkaline phosphatase synthesis response regulator PhoP